MPPDLYLASQSPRRAELLAQIGIQVDICNVNVDEVRQPNELPEQYVQRLALEKARAGMAVITEDSSKFAAPCLGSDTIVVIRDRVLEKPRDEADAIDMLMLLSGQCHHVKTAVAIVSADKIVTCMSDTRVEFREITLLEAQKYWRTGEPRDKAGGYGIQGLGAIFVAQMQGSYSGVVGLPLYETDQLLKKLGVR